MAYRKWFFVFRRLPSARNGFTLIELLLVTVILAIVSVFTYASWISYQKSQALETASRDLAAMLREAQGNAIGRVNDAHWGVRVWNSVTTATVVSCGSIAPPTGCNTSTSQCAELWWSAAATPVYTSANVVRRVMVSRGADYAAPPEGQCKDIVFEERTGKRSGAGGSSLFMVAYPRTGGLLRVARYTGSGGTGCTGGSPAWNCETVDDPANGVGFHASIAFDPSGNPGVSHQDTTALSLKVARYVGSGGNCDNVGAGSDAWNCETVDDPANEVGVATSIAVDPSGNAWVSYYDSTSGNLKAARYVGSGGNCDNVGAGSDAWNCEVVDGLANMGGSFGRRAAFDPFDVVTLYLTSQPSRTRTIRIGSEGGVFVE